MAKTARDVVTLALHSLNDQQALGMDADDQLALYNRALNTLFRQRPDLFVGALTAAPTPAPTLDAATPYDDEFVEIHAHLMVAEQKLVDDEEENQGKAGTFAKRAAGP